MRDIFRVRRLALIHAYIEVKGIVFEYIMTNECLVMCIILYIMTKECLIMCIIVCIMTDKCFIVIDDCLIVCIMIIKDSHRKGR